MPKSKSTAFFCKECGYESSKWMGQCPSCKSWNTMVEEPVKKSGFKIEAALKKNTGNKPVKLSDISIDDEKRTHSGMKELDRVLGGGVVNGSLVLVGGDPGIGKSTLLMQVCSYLSLSGKKVLYISGEESLSQIKMRARRLGMDGCGMLLLCETNLDRIKDTVCDEKPDFIVVDSIQTMYRDDMTQAPGSVSQVRECASLLLQIAKGMDISVFLIGHVTKEGMVAGPRVLEHMVDTVLYFEGDGNVSYRILRAVKNRFGSTNEIGVFEMRESGLCEVPNPSAFMLSGRPVNVPGSVVSCSMEGTRPILLEIQALVSRTNFGYPKRTAAGIDYNRVNLLMAVLEKKIGLHIADYDAYINVTGGIKISEPALDLAVTTAIISSFKNRVIENDTLIFGEVGLTGEIRGVNMVEQRIIEGKKMGFKKCILPKVSVKRGAEHAEMELIGARNLEELLSII